MSVPGIKLAASVAAAGPGLAGGGCCHQRRQRQRRLLLSRDISTDTNTAPRDDDVQSSYGAPVELKLLRDDDRSIWFVSSNLEVRSAAPLTYGRASGCRFRESAGKDGRRRNSLSTIFPAPGCLGGAAEEAEVALNRAHGTAMCVALPDNDNRLKVGPPAIPGCSVSYASGDGCVVSRKPTSEWKVTVPNDVYRAPCGGVLRGGGGGRGKGKLQGIWGLYLDSLERRPIRTKSLSSGIISGTANFIEQATGAASFNFTEWAAFTLVGALFIGSVLHHWYNFLDRLSRSDALTSRVKNKYGITLVVLAVDQTVGASIVNCGYFAAHTIFWAALTGQIFPLTDLGSSIHYKVTSRFWTMMINNLKIWPWVGFVNFAFVPVNLRVLVSNVVAVFWGILMSKWCK
eukprot:jgi/Undpi1/2831/HiC_scaffold_14.g06208.m1